MLIAVIAAGAVFGGAMLLSNSKATPLTAMVGFTYDGIEKGLDPNGNEFDANTLKSPSIIESTLTDLGMDTKIPMPSAAPSPFPALSRTTPLTS